MPKWFSEPGSTIRVYLDDDKLAKLPFHLRKDIPPAIRRIGNKAKEKAQDLVPRATGATSVAIYLAHAYQPVQDYGRGVSEASRLDPKRQFLTVEDAPKDPMEILLSVATVNGAALEFGFHRGGRYIPPRPYIAPAVAMAKDDMILELTRVINAGVIKG